MNTDDLRGLFLFEHLSEEQLAWLVAHGQVETHAAGTRLLREGEPATCFFVLLDGTVALSRTIGGQRVETNRTDHRGSYFGATQAYIGAEAPVGKGYQMNADAITDVRLYQLPADDFGAVFREWFPMAVHLLEGLFFGMRNTQRVMGERERLLALGALSAGLTHELNNPAAAAVRATSALRERVAGMRHKLALLAGGSLDPATLPALVRLQEGAVEQVAKAVELGPMEAADREDELADWLADHGVDGGWDLAPVLVAGGLDVDWLER
ncbi:cyclic nucleotide-binding domain-containing protein, partial [Actinosynnema sp. NPDC059797]